MKRVNLNNIDLNLLVAFDALVTEESVSRAANRIGLSQPAMSRALRQLRSVFDDDLFRRTSAGMIPTPRAVELARAIRLGLEHIAEVVGQKSGFDPGQAQRRFVVAMPDMPALLAFPAVARTISRHAPGIDIVLTSAGNRESLNRVESGQAEIALGVYDHLPNKIRARNLRALREVCVADPENSLIKGDHLDIDTFLSAPHVAVSMTGDFGTPIDSILETLGLQRRVAVKTPFFHSVPALVRGTNYIAIVVEDLLDYVAEGAFLRRYPIPVATEPVMSKMIWHSRSDDDAGHIWLRDVFLANP